MTSWQRMFSEATRGKKSRRERADAIRAASARYRRMSPGRRRMHHNPGNNWLPWVIGGLAVYGLFKIAQNPGMIGMAPRQTMPMMAEHGRVVTSENGI